MINYKFIVEHPNQRLDHYLVSRLPKYSRSKIQDYIKKGFITIDGKPTKSSFILNGKEIILCTIDEFDDNVDNILAEKIDLDIIYEDASLIVINKKAGIVVHPGNGNKSGTLLNGLRYHFIELSNKIPSRPGLVHRLDKDTSGVILCAKNNLTHDHIAEQFSCRSVKKEYFALVWGEIKNNGYVDTNIVRHPVNRKIFTSAENAGRKSYTEYELIKYYPPFSFIKVTPKTGRTHQIRVHMQSIGHPIVNDLFYGGGFKKAKSFHIKYSNDIKNLFKVIKRLCLHAYSITITHPLLNEKSTYYAPLANDIKLALNKLEE